MSGKRPADYSVEHDGVNQGFGAKRADRPEISVPALQSILKDSESGPYLIKILVPASCCAVLIGPKGSTMSSIKQISGAHIRLSNMNAYYPGTDSRVLSISGSPDKMAVAILEVLKTFLQETAERPDGNSSLLSAVAAAAFPSLASSSSSSSSSSQQQQQHHKYCVRALIPANAAGTVIGRGGTVIQRLAEETGCRLKFENTDQSSTHLSTKERILYIYGGDIGGIISAMQLSLAQMLTTPTCTYENPSVNYQPMGGGTMPFPQSDRCGQQEHTHHDVRLDVHDPHAHQHALNAHMHAQAAYSAGVPNRAMGYHVGMHPQHHHQMQHPMFMPQPEPATMFEIGVEDDKIGYLLGQQGRAIKEIMALSGTQITVSQKADYLPGTRNRRITLVGPSLNIQRAYGMITVRLASAPPPKTGEEGGDGVGGEKEGKKRVWSA